MHYLTNYYKNLSEQLQEKVNFLEIQLNEYLVRPGEKDGKKGIWYGPKFVPDEGRPTNTISLSPSPTTIPNRRISSPDSPERNPKNPFGPPIGREGEEGYWEEPTQLIGGPKEEARWIPGKRKPAIDKSTGKPIKLFEPRVDKNPKPASPEIQITPQRKPLIGKVPMSIDSDLLRPIPKRSRDELNVMPEPDRDEINIMPGFGQRGPVRPSKPYDFLTSKKIPPIDKPYIPSPGRENIFDGRGRANFDEYGRIVSYGVQPLPSNLKPISPGSKIYTPSVQDYSTFRDRYGIKKDTGPTPKYRG